MTDQPNLHDWQPLLDDLRARADAGRWAWAAPTSSPASGAAGKLPVRERLDLLLDPGSFVEFGMLADSMDPVLAEQRGYLAADGMVAGIGTIDGRRVAIAAYDFTVLAGSMGNVGEMKTTPHARAGRAPAHPDGVAARLGRRPHPGHAAARRSPVPVRCSASRSR